MLVNFFFSIYVNTECTAHTPEEEEEEEGVRIHGRLGSPLSGLPSGA
jgi:hypothetical protein